MPSSPHYKKAIPFRLALRLRFRRIFSTDDKFKRRINELKTYVVVNFLSQVIFIFLLFQLHQHILPYPKTKEKQKLPEIKN